jgi:DNA polymerase type B, organellar and viral
MEIKKQYKLKFRDSYLILLNSLSALCKSFQVDTPKVTFPIFFVNEENLNYQGDVPNQSFFKNITKPI